MLSRPQRIEPGSAWHTLEALLEVNRPGVHGAWRSFDSSRRIAWKTGTSMGFRDGWAIGVTPEYAVGVWVGNADGEGRPVGCGGQIGGRTSVEREIGDRRYALADAGEGDQPFTVL